MLVNFMSKYGYLRTSNNGLYWIGVEKIEDNQVAISVFDSKLCKRLNIIRCYGDLYGERQAVSDDGDMICSAEWDDFGKSTVQVCSVFTGEVICENKILKRIDWITFRNRQELYIGSNEKTYLLNICTNELTIYKYYKVVIDSVGNEIVLLKDNCLLMDKKIKSRTFSFFSPIRTDDNCVVISEIGGSLIKYNQEGKMVWEYKNEKYGHVTDIIFDQWKRCFYAYAFNIYTGEGHTLVLDYNGILMYALPSEKTLFLVSEEGCKCVNYDGLVISLD